MKDSIDNCDLLMIRACKRLHNYDYTIKILRRIVARRNALTLSYVKEEHVARQLVRIAFEYDLIRDLQNLIIVDLNPKKWYTNDIKPYLENLINEMISNISCSEISKFPCYPRPARFKNNQIQ